VQQQFASSAILNFADDAQPLVVASPRASENVFVADRWQETTAYMSSFDEP
jgi:hypothetical protein